MTPSLLRSRAKFASRRRRATGSIAGLALGVACLATCWATPVSAEPPSAKPPSAAPPSTTRASVDWFPEEVQLDVGEQYVLSADGVRSYSVGTQGVVDVRLTRDADRFVLVGTEPGHTTLLFIMLDGTERHLRLTVGTPEPKANGPKSGSELEVAARDNVRLDFYFVQLEKGYQHQVGVGWPGSVTAGASASFDFLSQKLQGATAVVENEALLRLDLAQATGFAKLMRQAAVITENGARATFSGGGEVNIPVQGSLATGIHKIAFGSTIEVLPRYDERTGRIQIEVHADVSDLTDDGGSGTPGRTTSELRTVVNVELGQAVVLAGLTAQSATRTQSGLPLLSQIPVLGLLFGSNRVQQRDVENVVFIVPSVLDSVDRDARGHIEAALDLFRDYDGDREDLEAMQTHRQRPERAIPPPKTAVTSAGTALPSPNLDNSRSIEIGASPSDSSAHDAAQVKP